MRKPRNALSAVAEQAQLLADTTDLETAQAVAMVLDIWADRQPLICTPEELQRFHDLCQVAPTLLTIEHSFKQALAVERLEV